MKPRMPLMLSMALAATLSCASFAAVAKTIKIATLAPEGTGWVTEMRAAGKEIEQRTDGRVKIKLYPGGVMGDASTVIKKMRIGQLHGGGFSGGALENRFADALLYSLPFLFRDYAEVDYLRSKLDAQTMANLESKDMVVLGVSEAGLSYMMSDTPVRTTDELRSKKLWIREGDEMSIQAVQKAGVSPVPLPVSDVYTGLQTGLVDSYIITPSGAIALQWYTKAQYATEPPLMYLIGMLALDKKTFYKLSADDQATTREVFGKAFDKLNIANRKSELEAFEALKTLGIEFVSAPPGETERWEAISEEVISDLAARGSFSPGLVDKARALLAEYRNKNK